MQVTQLLVKTADEPRDRHSALMREADNKIQDVHL